MASSAQMMTPRRAVVGIEELHRCADGHGEEGVGPRGRMCAGRGQERARLRQRRGEARYLGPLLDQVERSPAPAVEVQPLADPSHRGADSGVRAAREQATIAERSEPEEQARGARASRPGSIERLWARVACAPFVDAAPVAERRGRRLRVEVHGTTSIAAEPPSLLDTLSSAADTRRRPAPMTVRIPQLRRRRAAARALRKGWP
jgi:hypothetical protein